MTLKNIMILTLLVLIPLGPTYGQMVLKKMGQKAVIRTGDSQFEMGRKYILILKGIKKGTKRRIKKKAIIKVIKLKNDKALIRIIKGEVFAGAKITKMRALRKRKSLDESNVYEANQNSDQTEKYKRSDARNFKKIGVGGGPTLIKPGAIVSDGTDVGYEFAMMFGADLSLRYKVNPQFEVRGSFVYGTGSATFELLNSSLNYDTIYNYMALGMAYHFMKGIYGFLDYGITKLSLSTDITILGETTTSKTILSGKGYRVGLGYKKDLSQTMSLALEAGMSGISWSSSESDIEGSTSSTIDYGQGSFHLTAGVIYQF